MMLSLRTMFHKHVVVRNSKMIFGYKRCTLYPPYIYIWTIDQSNCFYIEITTAIVLSERILVAFNN